MTTSKYYIHIYDPKIDTMEYKYVNYKDIDLIKKSSSSEIFINDLLEYLSVDEASVCIDKIKTKLSKTGLLHLQNIDLKTFCLNIAYDQITSDLFNNIILEGVPKKHIYNLDSLKKLITSKGLIISKFRFLNGINFYIECAKS